MSFFQPTSSFFPPPQNGKVFTDENVPEDVRNRFPALKQQFNLKNSVVTQKIEASKVEQQEQQQPAEKEEGQNIQQSQQPGAPKVYTQEDVPEDIKKRFIGLTVSRSPVQTFAPSFLPFQSTPLTASFVQRVEPPKVQGLVQSQENQSQQEQKPVKVFTDDDVPEDVRSRFPLLKQQFDLKQSIVTQKIEAPKVQQQEPENVKNEEPEQQQQQNSSAPKVFTQENVPEDIKKRFPGLSINRAQLPITQSTVPFQSGLLTSSFVQRVQPPFVFQQPAQVAPQAASQEEGNKEQAGDEKKAPAKWSQEDVPEEIKKRFPFLQNQNRPAFRPL